MARKYLGAIKRKQMPVFFQANVFHAVVLQYFGGKIENRF